MVTRVDVCKSAQGLPKGCKLTEEQIVKTALGGPYLRMHFYTPETALRSTSSNSLESPTPSKQPHLEPHPVIIKCLLMDYSTTEQTSHSVQLVLTEEDVMVLNSKSHLRKTT